MKKKVLIMAGYYLPSVKGGGPIQSIKNLVDNLADRIEFNIVASDRDLGDDKPFESIEIDKWVKVGKANVYYTNIAKLNWRKTTNIINNSRCKTLYLNSFFSYKLATIPVLLERTNMINIDKIIIAPRGQFSAGALGLKNFKKKVFINITKMIDLYSNISWHATADFEKKDIQSIFGDKINLKIVNNLTENYNELTYDKSIEKKAGELKIVFISRVHPKKNLRQAIEFLKTIKGTISLDIYGPIEDSKYWEQCKLIIVGLPENITVKYYGVINHNETMNVFKDHHVFLFPTLGENFGHVISEALIGGCPVIISDRTPWRGLQRINVGWDINLIDESRFVNVIQRCIDMDENEYNELSQNAFEYGKSESNCIGTIKEYFNLFHI